MTGETLLQPGDSGAPNFYLVNGNMPAVIGINWYALQNSIGSGSTAVPKYLTGLQAAMAEGLTIVRNVQVPSESVKVFGDYSLDGQLNLADISAMTVALADLEQYKWLHGISQQYLLQIGDMNHDSSITNADLQGLIDALASLGLGAGGIATVPEPATATLFALGAVVFVCRCRGRKPRQLHR